MTFPIETSLKQPNAIIEQKIELLVDLQTSASFEDKKNRFDCEAAGFQFRHSYLFDSEEKMD